MADCKLVRVGELLMARITSCSVIGKIAALSSQGRSAGSPWFDGIHRNTWMRECNSIISDFIILHTNSTWNEVRNYAIGQMTGQPLLNQTACLSVDSLDHLTARNSST